jgi:hypothetical protein
MARKKPTTTKLATQSVALAEIAAKALVAAEQLRIKKKVVDGFPLDEYERAVAAELFYLPATLKKKLAKKSGTFTVADTASIVMALAESILEGEPLKRLALLVTAKKLIDCLESSVVPWRRIRASSPSRFH